jgi:hypothetical protein
MKPDVVGRRVRPTGQAGRTLRGVNDVVGAVRGKEGGSTHAARPGVWFTLPDGPSSGPPTA